MYFSLIKEEQSQASDPKQDHGMASVIYLLELLSPMRGGRANIDSVSKCVHSIDVYSFTNIP